MSENFRERLNIKLWNFDCPNRECVADFVEFHLLQFMLFEKTGKKLPICTRLRRLRFPCQEVMVRIFCVKLFDDIHQERWNWYRPGLGLRFWRSNVQIGCPPFLVIDALHRFVDGDCLIRKRNVLHLQAAQFPNSHTGKKRNQDSGGLSV